MISYFFKYIENNVIFLKLENKIWWVSWFLSTWSKFLKSLASSIMYSLLFGSNQGRDWSKNIFSLVTKRCCNNWSSCLLNNFFKISHTVVL